MLYHITSITDQYGDRNDPTNSRILLVLLIAHILKLIKTSFNILKVHIKDYILVIICLFVLFRTGGYRRLPHRFLLIFLIYFHYTIYTVYNIIIHIIIILIG